MVLGRASAGHEERTDTSARPGTVAATPARAGGRPPISTAGVKRRITPGQGAREGLSVESQWIKPKTDPAAPTVVFVHGIKSDGLSAWTNKKTRAYWPRMAADELSDAGVYVFSYYSSTFSGRYSVVDAADALWDDLKRNGILDSRIIVFVCHSLGGIVTRRLLTKRQGELAAQDAVIGLLLVASPSAGSGWANFFYPVINLMRQSQAQILKVGEDNQWLSTVNADFRSLLAKPKPMIRGLELLETRIPYVWWIPWIRPVVSRDEADRFFPESRPIPKADHISIAKPANPQAQQHLLLTEFANELAHNSFSLSLTLPAGLTFKQAIGVLASDQLEQCTVTYRGLSDAKLKTALPRTAIVSGADATAVVEQMIALYFGSAKARFKGAVKDGEITVEATP